MGLVGLHIMHNTLSAPQWIWSTFEQVDNVFGPHASFHNQSLSGSKANEQTKSGTPTQLTRVSVSATGSPLSSSTQVSIQPESGDLRGLNHAMQQALRREASVLQFYELIGTQWPVALPRPPSVLTAVNPNPAILANSTMESFTQESSSCMGCHAMARTSRSDRFTSADFTFTLNNALPEAKPDPQILPPPTRPVTEWDRANWRSIMRGRDLTDHTYERLPEFTGAKLHCGTCHQDSGRNPRSSWWVGMIAKYKYPETDLMYARVNQCFERSMNGSPIPVVVGRTKPNNEGRDMRAFIAYMQWLDEQYASRTSVPPSTGMLPIGKLEGDSVNGALTFVQKCAVCHGTEGKGRYGSGVYFRPALWGNDSFNDLAGMHTKPEKLASFIKSNMPFGSGGVLTSEEAWNLTAFLKKQPRPHRVSTAPSPFQDMGNQKVVGN